jgi:hypothetical protein
MGDYDDDIDAQIAALQAKAQQQAESRQQNASASGSKRRQLCARGCHLYKDDPAHLSSSKDKEKKGRKRGKAKPGKAKHVCPGACEGASVCPQRNNPDAWKRLHAPELAMEKLLKRKKRLEKVECSLPALLLNCVVVGAEGEGAEGEGARKDARAHCEGLAGRPTAVRLSANVICLIRGLCRQVLGDQKAGSPMLMNEALAALKKHDKHDKKSSSDRLKVFVPCIAVRSHACGLAVLQGAALVKEVASSLFKGSVAGNSAPVLYTY